MPGLSKFAPRRRIEYCHPHLFVKVQPGKNSTKNVRYVTWALEIQVDGSRLKETWRSS
jgi:hypothetical protein